MDSDSIEPEATRYIKHIVEAFHQNQPDVAVTGMSCECDPGAASLYVHLCTDSDDPEDDPLWWQYSLVEQQVESTQPPSWFSWYDDLLESSVEEGGNSGYTVVEEALAKILTGVAKAMASLDAAGELSACGFVDGAILSVVTEDDDDLMQGRERVAVHRYKYQSPKL